MGKTILHDSCRLRKYSYRSISGEGFKDGPKCTLLRTRRGRVLTVAWHTQEDESVSKTTLAPECGVSATLPSLPNAIKAVQRTHSLESVRKLTITPAACGVSSTSSGLPGHHSRVEHHDRCDNEGTSKVCV